jgi:hypothetical protein
MMSHSITLATHLAQLAQAAGSDSVLGAALPLTIAAVVAGLYVTLRIIAIIGAVVRALVQIALAVGTSVLVIGIFGGLMGITYLTR